MVGEGVKPTEVARRLGVSRSSVYEWLKRMGTGGDRELETRPRSGRPRVIDERLVRFVARMVANTDPRHSHHLSGLWSRQSIGELVQSRLEAKLSRWSVGRLLQQLGLEPQRPSFEAWRSHPGDIGHWARKQLPWLRDYAKGMGAKCYFTDLALIDYKSHVGPAWREGVDSIPRRSDCSMISAISPTRTVRFMIAERNDTAARFGRFIERLMVAESGDVVLIVVDDFASHIRTAREVVRKFDGRLHLYLISSYDPERIPREIKPKKV